MFLGSDVLPVPRVGRSHPTPPSLFARVDCCVQQIGEASGSATAKLPRNPHLLRAIHSEPITNPRRDEHHHITNPDVETLLASVGLYCCGSRQSEATHGLKEGSMLVAKCLRQSKLSPAFGETLGRTRRSPAGHNGSQR